MTEVMTTFTDRSWWRRRQAVPSLAAALMAEWRQWMVSPNRGGREKYGEEKLGKGVFANVVFTEKGVRWQHSKEGREGEQGATIV